MSIGIVSRHGMGQPGKVSDSWFQSDVWWLERTHCSPRAGLSVCQSSADQFPIAAKVSHRWLDQLKQFSLRRFPKWMVFNFAKLCWPQVVDGRNDLTSIDQIMCNADPKFYHYPQ